MISERISDDEPPQINFEHDCTIKMFPSKKTVKMHFIVPTSKGYQLQLTARQLHILTCQPIKSDVT